MRIQIDSDLKVIRVEETVNFGELIKVLDKLLPKNSLIGYWKDFKLETNTVIYNWNYPIIYQPLQTQPFYPTYSPIVNLHLPFTTCNEVTINSSSPNGIFNIEYN